MRAQFICIAGGAGGIGTAIVRQYAQLPNTKVIVIDQNPLPDASRKNNVELFLADLTQSSDIANVAAALSQKTVQIDHLISLAGGALPNEWSKLALIPDHVIEQSIKLNLVSHILLAKHLINPTEKGLNRSITFISSINALRSYHLTPYSAAKAGLLGLTNELAGSLAPSIRVNAILPGTVETPRTKKEPKDFRILKQKTLLGRFAQSKDVAAACYFLTHMTDAVTGASIIVDAGQTISTK